MAEMRSDLINLSLGKMVVKNHIIKIQQRQDSCRQELELKDGVVYFVSVCVYINGLLNSGS